jgi:hypothetical protein
MFLGSGEEKYRIGSGTPSSDTNPDLPEYDALTEKGKAKTTTSHEIQLERGAISAAYIHYSFSIHRLNPVPISTHLKHGL